jgi:O-antigen/teichoic acid export membrane protein
VIRLRHLAGDTAIYGLVSTARSLVGLLLVPIYTRVFMPGDYGRIDTLTTLVVALTLMLTLGMDTSVALFFYDNKGDQDRATMLSTAIVSRVGISALAAFLITLLAPLISQQLFGTKAAANAVRLAVWTAPASALVGFLIELLRLGRKRWLYSLLAVANLLLGVLLSILFVVVWHWGIDGAFAGPLVANLLVLPSGVFMSRRLLSWRLSPTWLGRLLRIGLPMVPAAFGGWIIAYANRYFLLYFASAAAVGLLAVGNKASAPLVLFTSAFRTAWTPFAFSVQKQENAREVYAKTLTHFCVISGAMAVAVGLFAREMLLIFTTTQYIDGHVVAGLMAFQLIVDSSYYIVSIGLVLSKRTGALAYTVPIAAVGSIVLNLALVPAFGFFGAALANTLSYCLSTLLAYVMSQRVYKVPYEIFKLARLAALCVGVWVLGLVIGGGAIWLAIAIKSLLFVGFVVGLFVLRIVTVEEARALLSWLHRQTPASLTNASAHLQD